jgi:DNA repair photolyase
MNEIICKTILSKSRLEDYSVNPYRGCTHCCKYCYAPYILREKREWGTFIEPKVNAPEVLEKELKKNKPGNIFISSVTDPYNSLEEKYKLTRRILGKLINTKFSASIQTKSPLILRDLDLLKQINCEVGMTITTFDEKARKVFEPNASSSLERLEALKKLKQEGIRTYIFFGPMLPFISDKDLDETVKKFATINPDKIFADRLNIKSPAHWTKLKSVLEKNYPELVEKWQSILFSENDYYEGLKERLTCLFRKYGLKYVFCY